jgi:hypothetical protein
MVYGLPCKKANEIGAGMSGFSRKRNGEILATFSHYEGAILKSLTEQILELLGEGDAPADPLLAVVGISSNDSLPEDPVLARLLPDAYEEEPDAAEFRRYTEHSAREKKRSHAHAIRDILMANLGDHALDLTAPGLNKREELHFIISEEKAQMWLMGLNDMRLALGTRLNVTSDAQERFAAMSEENPDKGIYNLFAWLGWQQEILLDVLSGEIAG